MNYSEINLATTRAMKKNQQANIFANKWEDSAKLIASLTLPKKELENLPANADEESFIAKSAVLPALISNVNIDELSLTDLILMSQAAKAIETGDSKAATFFRDTSGGKPVEKIENHNDGNLANLTDEQVEYLLKHAKVEDE